MVENDLAWVKDRIERYSSVRVAEKLQIVTDTTEFMDIYRGQVVCLDGVFLFVTGNIYETRFGLSGEPKYWVKRAIDLETGTQQIVKLVYHETFQVRVGPLRIRCYREPHKETRVLELARGHSHFMQGRGLFDQKGNEVRTVDYIRGKSLYNHILFDISLPHEEYFHTVFPRIFLSLMDCFSAIGFLHDNDLCHGDIRNDHILIEEKTGLYRWIDFDLKQDFSDFDIWSLGNVLLFCAGMGTKTFHEVLQSQEFSDSVKMSLTADDASAFYEHRIINLKKLFPHIPDRLNDILLHFAKNTTRFYETTTQIVTDMGEALGDLSKA